MSNLGHALFQASFCLLAILVLRLALVNVGARFGAVLLGMSLIVFPLLVVQVIYGPPISTTQTQGSLGAMTAVTCALWVLRWPMFARPIYTLLALGLAWTAVATILYLLRVPASLMAVIIATNAVYIFVRYRSYRPAIPPRKGKVTDGAVTISIFILAFFRLGNALPEYIRGVFVSFPLGILATIYFVKRLYTADDFRDFVIYTHGSISGNAAFVIAMHFVLIKWPVSIALAVALSSSFAMTGLAAVLLRPSYLSSM